MERRSRRRRMLVVAAAGGVLALAAGLAWFQPQKLLIDERVDEALPAAATAPPGTPGDTAPAQPQARRPDPEPKVLAAGPFRSLGHATSGRAVALELADGRRFLRLEQLRTSNGPDLFVYLSTAAADAPRDTFETTSAALAASRPTRAATTTRSAMASRSTATARW